MNVSVITRAAGCFLFCLTSLPLFAQTAVAEPEQVREYPSKISGDNTLKSQSYDTAASFYAAYRKEAEKRKDDVALRDAYECEINAWILGGHATPAEAVLKAYLKRFPDAEKRSIALWSADIALLKNKPDDAEKLLTRLIAELPDNDPRKLRAMVALASAHEMKKAFSAAASLYADILKIVEDSPSASRIMERRILMLAAGGNTAEALECLKNLKLNEDERSIEAFRLLNIYLALKNDSAKSVEEAFATAKKAEMTHSDPFFFLVSSLIGDQFAARGDYASALEAYRMAFQYARSSQNAFDAVAHVIEMFSRMEKRSDAAALAVTQMDLFKRPSTPLQCKLFVARLLTETSHHKEAQILYEDVFTGLTGKTAEFQKLFDSEFQFVLKQGAWKMAESLNSKFFTPPNSAGSLVNQARIAYAQGSQADAAALYWAAAKTDPKIFMDAGLRAFSYYMELHDYAHVIELAAQILSKDPGNTAVLFSRAEALEQKNDFAGAGRDYQTILDIKNVSVDTKMTADFRLGLLRFRERNYGDAQKYFSIVFRAESKIADSAGFWIVLCGFRSGNTSLAERATKDLLKRFPGSRYAGSAALQLIDFYVNAGLDKKAEDLLKQLKELYGQSADLQARVIFREAMLAYRNGDLSGALACLDKIFTAYPKSETLADAYYLQGDILKKQNAFEKALEAYRKVPGQNPQSHLAQAALGSAGDCCFAIACRDDARANMRKALAFYNSLLERADVLPEYRAMTLYKSGRCYQVLEQPQDALRQYKTLVFGSDPEWMANHPVELFWIRKAVGEMERMVLSQQKIELIDDTIRALNLLGRNGFEKADVIRKRVSAMKKLKRKMIISGENEK